MQNHTHITRASEQVRHLISFNQSGKKVNMMYIKYSKPGAGSLKMWFTSNP